MKQKKQLSYGKRITEYIKKWIDRCYINGIPDEVPNKLAKSNRAPSYKAIAIAILKNDHSLKTLGLKGTHSKWYDEYKRIELKERYERDNRQVD
jgi:predicted phosphoadenosine phosphosulfate sulfurtransferase